jgi:hypothetical protein
MTVRAFARTEGLTESSLYKWLRRERVEGPRPELVEVVPAGLGEGFAIATPAGYRIEVPVGFSTDELKRLLGALAG